MTSCRYPNQAKAIRAWSRRRQTFDRVVLDHVDRRAPKPLPQIHGEVLNDWGRVSIRSTYRAIARLRDRRRAIRRTPDGYVRTQARRSR